MASVSRPPQRPRGPPNELHDAAADGSTGRLVRLLSDGSIDIDQGDPQGWSPLMLATYYGHSLVVRVLLNKGADVSIAGDAGATALHFSVQEGHLAVTKTLVNAGADLKTTLANGATPLHLAAEEGHHELMSVLIEAGANLDSCASDGATPLYLAAHGGHVDATKVLLRAKANPLLTRLDDESGRTLVPLDSAASNGHAGVVLELVQHVGIEGCGGASGGADALELAAMNQYLDIMAVLTDAGVVDAGRALAAAAMHGGEQSVKFLLRQRKDDEAAYADIRDSVGMTPLLGAFGISSLCSPSPRIVRLLVDAGAETTSAVRITNSEGEVVTAASPLAAASRVLRDNKIAGKGATEHQRHRLEGTRRLLLQVEAVHAVSFLWPVCIPSMIGAAEGASRKVAASTPLRMMLPILRLRARRPRVLLAALVRNSQKEF